MVIQTRGISGEVVSTAIPFPADINSASVAAAIQALGTVKAKIYDPKTRIHPRVLAVENIGGGGSATINEVISAILERPRNFLVEEGTNN